MVVHSRDSEEWFAIPFIALQVAGEQAGRQAVVGRWTRTRGRVAERDEGSQAAKGLEPKAAPP